MTKTKSKKKGNETWEDVARICRLTSEQVKRAKSMGMKPRSVIANYRSTKQQKWKQQTGDWIDNLYEKKKR